MAYFKNPLKHFPDEIEESYEDFSEESWPQYQELNILPCEHEADILTSGPLLMVACCKPPAISKRIIYPLQ